MGDAAGEGWSQLGGAAAQTSVPETDLELQGTGLYGTGRPVTAQGNRFFVVSFSEEKNFVVSFK